MKQLFYTITNAARQIGTEDRSKTAYLTGIRAYAALAVVFTHSQLLISNNSIPDLLTRFLNFGKYGVVVFFVLSAFTILISINRPGKFIWRDYLIKRIFRIIPLFYTVLIVAFLSGGSQYYLDLFGITNSIKGLISSLTFLNLFDLRFRNHLIGVEWTIAIELVFYAVIPLIWFYLKSKPKHVFHIVLVSFIITWLTPVFLSAVNIEVKALAENFSPFKYVFTYCMSILLYWHTSKKRSSVGLSFWNLSLLVTCLMLFVLIGNQDPYAETVFVTIWSMILIYLCSRKTLIRKSIFENPIVVALGKLSYSIYLIHFLVFTHLPTDYPAYSKLLIGFILTLLISLVTYLLVEQPMIVFGRFLIKKLDS